MNPVVELDIRGLDCAMSVSTRGRYRRSGRAQRLVVGNNVASSALTFTQSCHVQHGRLLGRQINLKLYVLRGSPGRLRLTHEPSAPDNPIQPLIAESD